MSAAEPRTPTPGLVRPAEDEPMSESDGGDAPCYLCAPDDPDASMEACDRCETEFWDNPLAIVLDEEDA